MYTLLSHPLSLVFVYIILRCLIVLMNSDEYGEGWPASSIRAKMIVFMVLEIAGLGLNVATIHMALMEELSSIAALCAMVIGITGTYVILFQTVMITIARGVLTWLEDRKYRPAKLR